MGRLSQSRVTLLPRLAPAMAAVLLLAPPSRADETSTLLADLGPDVVEALGAREEGLPPEPAELLDLVFRTGPTYFFREGPLTVRTDRRWYSTLPPEAPGAPLLVVRRWPGETVAAFYALEGAAPADPAALRPPPFAGAPAAVPRDTPEGRRWELTLDTELGEREALWLERAVPEASWRLGILLVPGDAGLGAESVRDRRQELLAVARRVELDPGVVAPAPRLPPGGSATPPELGSPPGPADEGRDPWQVGNGVDFTLGLPPGLKVKAVHGVPAPRPVSGQRLWIRGRFLDRDGVQVVVGDAFRAGYVSVLPEAGGAWRTGRTPPLGVSGGKMESGDEFDVAEEATGCRPARAERWSEPGFDGQWWVFRLGCRDRGIEIGLPVTEGRRSLALFWIPVTWRDAGRPPAPPPIDAAERFGIRFERLLGRERRTHPMTEGYLVVPGLRLQVPKGWAPVANLRSTDGFPIGFWDEEGDFAGQLVKTEPGAEARATEAEGWSAHKRPRAYGAVAVHRRRDGTWLYVSPYGTAFRLESAGLEGASGKVWERMAETVELRRPPR